MNLKKVRISHRRLGISIAFFLFVQAIAGMLMSVGRLASVEMSPPYNVLYFIHADWDGEEMENLRRQEFKGIEKGLEGRGKGCRREPPERSQIQG